MGLNSREGIKALAAMSKGDPQLDAAAAQLAAATGTSVDAALAQLTEWQTQAA